MHGRDDVEKELILNYLNYLENSARRRFHGNGTFFAFITGLGYEKNFNH
jgi:hypothetical protein